MLSNIKVYVINLERDSDRRENMRLQISQQSNLEGFWVKAIDGAVLPSALLIKSVMNRDWVKNMPGTIGCFLSHIAAWEAIAEDENAVGLVVEDDVSLGNFRDLTDFSYPADADIIFLNDRLCFSESTANRLAAVPIVEALHRLESLKIVGGGDGYLLSRSAARKLLSACERDGVFGHVDGRLLRYVTTEENLESLGPHNWIATVVRSHHNPVQMPSMGILKGYVLNRPLVMHGAAVSSREKTDSHSSKVSSLRAMQWSSKKPTPAANIPIRYWSNSRNVGDLINPDVVEHVGGVKPVFSFEKNAPHLLGIGSIFFMATESSHIWGSGILDPEHTLDNVNLNNIHAVRGVLSLEHLRKSRGFNSDIPLGDPGLLIDELPMAQALKKRAVPRWRCSIIPHHAMLEHPYFKDLAKNEDVRLLDVRLGLQDFIEGLLSSEFVISQSLHGMIFSEALGIPYSWTSANLDSTWLFKFKDWFSTTQCPERSPTMFGLSLAQHAAEARLSGSTVDRKRLKSAFPSDLISVATRAGFSGFRESRLHTPLTIFTGRKPARPLIGFSSKWLPIPAQDEGRLRAALDFLAKDFDDVVRPIIVFDDDLFQRITISSLERALDTLENNVNTHYVHLVADVATDSAASRSTLDDFAYEKDEKLENHFQGVVIARHLVGFHFKAPSLLLRFKL